MNDADREAIAKRCASDGIPVPPDLDAETVARINAFRFRWPESWRGPAHLVLTGWSFNEAAVRYCLAECDKGTETYRYQTTVELSATTELLLSLLP